MNVKYAVIVADGNGNERRVSGTICDARSGMNATMAKHIEPVMQTGQRARRNTYSLDVRCLAC